MIFISKDNVEEDEDEDNYLIITNHHARELVTPEIALNLTLHLLTNCILSFVFSNESIS